MCANACVTYIIRLAEIRTACRRASLLSRRAFLTSRRSRCHELLIARWAKGRIFKGDSIVSGNVLR